MSWFDVTPIGRLLNIATKDVDAMDHVLPIVYQYAFVNLFTIFVTCLMASIVTPPFTVVFVLYIAGFFVIIKRFLTSATLFKRLTQAAISPILSNISELVNGIITFRAFGKLGYQNTEFKHSCDQMHRC
jgi:ABC-type multidrug transport system fused ATPase/permease subunit